MKIVVVGAGTAGWLSASAIKKRCPDADVTIIYDSKTPTVGVGETLGYNMPSVLHELVGLEEDQWMDQTKAIYKTAILYENWVNKGISDLMPHFYEFDVNMLLRPDLESQVKARQQTHINDGPNIAEVWYTMWKKNKLSLDFSSFPEFGGDGYYFAKNNRAIRTLDGSYLLSKYSGYSYQYDAELVGTTIGNLVGRPLGVKEVDSKITDVLINESGITGVAVANGEVVTGDIFVDCSGFRRLLMEKLDNTWVDFDEFYNNTALVTPVQFDDNGHPVHSFRPVTVLAGMDQGWRFSVNIRSRNGNGYIFNSRQVKDIDSVKNEFRAELGIGPDRDFRTLSWRPGYYQNIYHKNCFAMGLSMGFGDPFDANNLGLATNVLRKFVNLLSAGDYNNLSSLNASYQRMWQEIDLRVQSVLRLGPRRDTPHYQLMAQVAEDTNLKQRWIDHVVGRRQNYFSTRHQYLFPTRVHIGIAVRYGIDLPLMDVDPRYYSAVNRYFEDINDRGLKLSQSAPTSSEYYNARKQV